MTERLRWGVAGYGDVVTRRALPALRASGHQVNALWGRDPRRAAETARRHRIVLGTSRFDELLDRVDVVYVATPVASHLPLAVAAVRAGRHVLVEKPLRADLPEGIGPDAGSLARLARRHGVRAGVAYYRRLSPALVRLRAGLPAGRVRRVTVRFRQPFEPAPDHPMWWRTVRSVSGGGVLADAGSHRLDLLGWLLGPPVTVSARLADRFPGGAERRAELRLRWDPGARADCEFGWVGEECDELSLEWPGGAASAAPLDSGRLRWYRDGEVRDERFDPPGNPHGPLFDDFADAVRERRDPVCPLAEAMLVDRITAAAARSAARDGAPEPVPPA